MNFLESYRINTPTVVYEIFDEEVVVIHLDSGNYYTLDQRAAQIWALLNQGMPTAVMLTTLAGTAGRDTTALAATVTQFLHKLQQEQLIVPVVEPSHDLAAFQSVAQLPVAHGALAEGPISFKKYTDMQDLLLLDPIHDVAETGWPSVKHP